MSSSVPHLADLALALPDDLAAESSQATSAIRGLEQECAALPGSLSEGLVWVEAAASARLSGATAPVRVATKAKPTAAERAEALRAADGRRALRTGLDRAGDLDPQWLQQVQAELVRHDGSGETRLRPEPGLPEALEDLFAFAVRTDVPALAQAAVVLGQVDALQPFGTGDGRAARVLAQAVLRRRGLTRHAVLPLSAGLLGDEDRYRAALDRSRDGDFTPLVGAVAEAAGHAVHDGRLLVLTLAQLRQTWHDALRARSRSNTRILLDLLWGQPVMTSVDAGDALGVTHSNVLRPVYALEEAGILVETTAGQRKRVWRADAVLDAFDAFAARAARRRHAA